MKYLGFRYFLYVIKINISQVEKKMRLEKCLYKNDYDILFVYMNLKFFEKKLNRYILVVVLQVGFIFKIIGCIIILFYDLQQ